METLIEVGDIFAHEGFLYGVIEISLVITNGVMKSWVKLKCAQDNPVYQTLDAEYLMLSSDWKRFTGPLNS